MPPTNGQFLHQVTSEIFRFKLQKLIEGLPFFLGTNTKEIAVKKEKWIACLLSFQNENSPTFVLEILQL